MENTLSVYVESLNETWEMPDEMSMKLNEYYKDHPLENDNADKVHQEWFDTLTAEEQSKIQRHKPQD